MPLLLFRQLSPSSLTAVVEKSQRQPIQSAPQYDLQLRNNQLDLILLSQQQFPPIASKPAVPPKPLKTGAQLLVKSLPPIAPKGGAISTTVVADEGFESDIDTISLISSENESFGADKSVIPKPGLAETDSANGGSGTESETETEKTNTLTQKNVNSIKEGFEFRQRLTLKPKETFDLVDCVCYTDVTYPDVLIFVIKEEAFVFKFENLERLQNFYANFTTVKAVANQKAYNLGKNVATKYNLLQRTDQNGVMHIEIKKQNLPIQSTGYGKESSSIISIDTPDGSVTKKLQDIEEPQCNNNNNKVKDVNLRQRAESKLITDMKLLNDVKFNTINNKVGQKKMMVRSSSIENILNIDGKESNLVKAGEVGSLRKVWNSAEDLLDSDVPRRPDRRRKKKPAPLPPTQKPPSEGKAEDVYSGQFVRVSVVNHNNNDPLKEFADKTRLVVKSSANEPHPKKLGQNFNLLGRNNLTSLIKPNKNDSRSQHQVLRYLPDSTVTLNRPQRTPLYEKHNSWTNSVPRILKKSSSRSKSETRNNQQQPMAYRYIDTTVDYGYHPASNNTTTTNNNNAMFLTATGLSKPRNHSAEPLQRKHHNIESLHHQPRISFGYNVGGFKKKDQQLESAMGNRVFGLTPKLKDFTSKAEGPSKWGSETDLRFVGSEKLDKNNLKSSIKSGEGVGKKKNDKKVTFSAYTTVQVV